MIGTLRRKLLDHVIVLNEKHLLRLLKEFLVYYITRRGLIKRWTKTPRIRVWSNRRAAGNVKAIPYLGGLHHRYTRAA